MGGVYNPDLGRRGIVTDENPDTSEPGYIVWSISNVKIDGNEARFDIVTFADNTPRRGKVVVVNPLVTPKDGDYWMVPKGQVRGTVVSVDRCANAT